MLGCANCRMPRGKCLKLSLYSGGRSTFRPPVFAAGLSSRVLEALPVLRAEHFRGPVWSKGREEIETYHDRIRETVVAHLEPRVLTAHHRALALAFESNVPGADPETLQIHFRGAGDNERAAQYAIIAADRAADALAFDRAARLSTVCARHESRSGPEPAANPGETGRRPRQRRPWTRRGAGVPGRSRRRDRQSARAPSAGPRAAVAQRSYRGRL